MASIVPGYEYDIFISYRHNDNRSGWVTEFVNALQEELAATIKEPVSVYFDTNPHDGLLETHNVDKSLEEKLKCLIFIPIISQTYCDTGCFAWQREFVVFNNLVKEDLFGRDIKLGNGNVASRILPVKIHEIDSNDKAILENELGGVLRAIEFIYKETGVNRPLKSTDSKTDNQNKTDYQNQVNKVANALKEIITSLKSPATTIKSHLEHRNPILPGKHNVSSGKKITIISSAVIILLVVISIFFPQRHNSSESPVSQQKTIGVIPFVNLSSGKEDEYFTDGMCNEILTQLFKIGSLNVIPRTTMLQFKNTQKTVKEIAESVGADVLLEGSVQKSDNKVHINIQLIDAKLGKQIWAETYDKEFKDIFSIQSDVAGSVAAKLEANVTISEKARIQKRPTQNIEAYNLYLKGNFEITKSTSESLETGFAMMNQAINLDPDFASAYVSIAWYYTASSDVNLAPNVAMPQVKIAAQTALEKDSTLADAFSLYGGYNLYYAWDWVSAEKQITKAIQLGSNLVQSHLNYSWYLSSQGKFSEAIRESKRPVELEPMNALMGSFHALTYYLARQYDEALIQCDRVKAFETDQPYEHFVRGQCYIRQRKFADAITEQKLFNELVPGPWTLGRLAYAYASAGETRQTMALLDSLKKQSVTQYVPSDVVASVYVALGDYNHAFEYLEKAVSDRAGWLIWINVDPIWDPIRKDPRFISILKRMRLED